MPPFHLIAYSPITALNRTYALSKVKGKQEAIQAAEKINLKDNHFYHVLLGELYTGIENDKAKQYFQKGLLLAKTQPEKQVIQNKIEGLSGLEGFICWELRMLRVVTYGLSYHPQHSQRSTISTNKTTLRWQ